MTEPSRVVTSQDGTRIAIFVSGGGPPLVLVHGASADHTTFRVLGPRLAQRFTIHAIDRRGRGASGDTEPYAIEREFEDVAAVAKTLASGTGEPVDVFGHSFGGRCALGAALQTDTIRRVISYEGAPAAPGQGYGDRDVLDELGRLADAGDHDTLLATFMTRVVGMGAEDLAAYQNDPIWPIRAAAAPTIVRELRAESGDAANLDTLGAVRQPVLQFLGGESLPPFAAATRALDSRLVDGRVVVIPGARHAAHHTHPVDVARAIDSFLDM